MSSATEVPDLDLVPVAADIATGEGLEAVMAAAGGRVDALANVAGIMDAFLPLAWWATNATITWLLSDDASNVNGAILPSDGGWSAI
jgi:NAD(P)-dependent dehydrogenase (short-subunit alcohol dehydrogenase family)